MTRTVVTRSLLAAALAGTAGLAAACGSAHASAKLPQPTVAVALMPPSLNHGAVTVVEDQQARKQFATAKSSALITDGRLWGLRRGQQLVATLQISTLKPKVDLSKDSQRTAIISQIVAGATQTIRVNSVDVAENTTPSTTVYVWFGRDLFEVLQVRVSKQAPIDANALLDEIVAYQTARPEWHGLPRSAP